MSVGTTPMKTIDKLSWVSEGGRLVFRTLDRFLAAHAHLPGRGTTIRSGVEGLGSFALRLSDSDIVECLVAPTSGFLTGTGLSSIAIRMNSSA
jgi:hypothetical protein